MTREQMIKLGNDVYGRGTYNVEVYAGKIILIKGGE